MFSGSWDWCEMLSDINNSREFLGEKQRVILLNMVRCGAAYQECECRPGESISWYDIELDCCFVWVNSVNILLGVIY